MSNDEGRNEVVQITIKDVTREHFKVCLLAYEVTENPNEPEIIGHFHVVFTKEDGDYHIVDADDDTDQPGVSIPSVVLRGLMEFIAQIDKDPTPVMTDGEKAQFMADQLVAAMTNPN